MFNVNTYYASSIINTEYNDCSPTIYILKGGEQNRQGGPISATKLVPGRTNFVAVLVPGGPILGVAKFGMTSQLHSQNILVIDIFKPVAYLQDSELCMYTKGRKLKDVRS